MFMVIIGREKMGYYWSHDDDGVTNKLDGGKNQPNLSISTEKRRFGMHLLCSLYITHHEVEDLHRIFCFAPNDKHCIFQYG